MQVKDLGRFWSLLLSLMMVVGVGQVGLQGLVVRASNQYDTTKLDRSLVYNGHKYQVFNNCTTWEEAKKYCEGLGGYLAVINNKDENTALYNYIRELGYESAYFGYTDSKTEGVWKWVENDSSNFVNWASGEPNNENSSENYAMFYYKFTDGTWNDGDFNGRTVRDTSAFICEWNRVSNGDGNKIFHAMILNGVKGEMELSGDNSAALMYTRLCDNELSEYDIKTSNIHPFFYNNHNDSTDIADINSMIKYSFKDTDDDDLSVFYYIGHSTWDGTSAKDYGISLGNHGYYKWENFTKYLSDNIKGKIVIIMESCFSGNLIEQGIASLSQRDKSRISIISSTSSSQSSKLEGFSFIFHDSLYYGRLTYNLGYAIGFFDEKLKADKNDDKKITLQELYSYVKENVYSQTPKNDTPMDVQMYTQDSNFVLFEYRTGKSILKENQTIDVQTNFTKELNDKSFSLNAKAKTKLSYRSLNPNIATVDSNGKVTLKAIGTVKIVISATSSKTYNPKEKTVTIVVKNTVPTGVSLNKNQVSLGKGETTKLTAAVSPSNAIDKSIKWRTSNSKILTVDQNGNVKAVGTGVAWITVRTANGIEKSCKITVKNAPTNIVLTKGILTLGVGEKYTVGSSVNDGAACAKRTYRTSNSSIVKMTRTDWVGDMVAVKPGVAWVTVRTYNGKESTCRVTVKPAPNWVKLNKTNITLRVGQTASLSAIIPDGTGCATRTFSSSNNSVVKMTKTNWTGEFKAMKRGTAYVTVRTYNGKTATCKVTVQ